MKGSGTKSSAGARLWLSPAGPLKPDLLQIAVSFSFHMVLNFFYLFFLMPFSNKELCHMEICNYTSLQPYICHIKQSQSLPTSGGSWMERSDPASNSNHICWACPPTPARTSVLTQTELQVCKFYKSSLSAGMRNGLARSDQRLTSPCVLLQPGPEQTGTKRKGYGYFLSI